MNESPVLRISGSSPWPHPLGLSVRQPPVRDRRLPPLLLLHGATFSGGLFDLPRAGYSLMAGMSAQGRPVYALDVRGYGYSLAGKAMEECPARNPPFARANEVAADVAAGVEAVLEHEAATAIDLAGFSWGTILACVFAASFPEKVRRLALYAPLYMGPNGAWLDRIADPRDRTRLAPQFGAYRFMTEGHVLARWDAELANLEPDRYREPGIAQIAFEAMCLRDPGAASRAPRAFRCPNGALADLVDIFNGRPLYDPTQVKAPTLLLRGNEDTTSTDTDCRQLSAELAAKHKDYRVIASGSHFLCIEKNRSRLYDELDGFFEAV